MSASTAPRRDSPGAHDRSARQMAFPSRTSTPRTESVPMPSPRQGRHAATRSRSDAAISRRRIRASLGAWSLHPSQIDIAKKVFSPDPADVAFAKKIVAAMPDGAGAVMIDGKMQDDATWKQAKVLLDLAKLVAAKDPDMAARYAL